MARKEGGQAVTLLLCLVLLCFGTLGHSAVLRGARSLDFTSVLNANPKGKPQDRDANSESKVRFGKLLVQLQSEGFLEGEGYDLTNEDVKPGGYQSDQAGWSELQHIQELVHGFSAPSYTAVQRLLGMRPKVECVKDSMMLKIRGESADFGRGFLVDRGTVPPLPLWRMPSHCGFDVRKTWLTLVIIIPYDGCYVAHERDSYVLPFHLWGLPAKMSCPALDLPSSRPSPPSVSCYPNGMIVKAQKVASVENLWVKVKNEWQPLLKASSQCGFSVVSHAEGVVISAPYKPCMEEKDKLYSLHIGTEREFNLFCPSVVTSLPLNLSSSDFPSQTGTAPRQPTPTVASQTTVQSLTTPKPSQVGPRPTSVPTSTVQTSTTSTTTAATTVPITPKKDYQMPFVPQLPQFPQLPSTWYPFSPMKPPPTSTASQGAGQGSAPSVNLQRPKPEVSVTSTPITTTARAQGLMPSKLLDDPYFPFDKEQVSVHSPHAPHLPPSHDFMHPSLPGSFGHYAPSKFSIAHGPQGHYPPWYPQQPAGFPIAAPSQPFLSGKMPQASHPVYQTVPRRLGPLGYSECCLSAALYSSCCPPPVSYHQHSHHHFGQKYPVFNPDVPLNPTRNVTLKDPSRSIVQDPPPVARQVMANYGQSSLALPLQEATQKIFRPPLENLFPATLLHNRPLWPIARPQTVHNPFISPAKHWSIHVPHIGDEKPKPYSSSNMSDYRPLSRPAQNVGFPLEEGPSQAQPTSRQLDQLQRSSQFHSGNPLDPLSTIDAGTSFSQTKIPYGLPLSHGFLATPENPNQYSKVLEERKRLIKQPPSSEAYVQPNTHYQGQIPSSFSGPPNPLTSDPATEDSMYPFQVDLGPFRKHWVPVVPPNNADSPSRRPSI